MKNVIFAAFLAVSMLLSHDSIAQSAGDKSINFSLGLFPVLVSGSKTSIPNLQISGDYFIQDNISVGPYLSVYGAKTELEGFIDDYTLKQNIITIGARGTYQLKSFIDKLDMYGGVMLGYNITNVKVEGGSGDFGDLFESSEASGFGYQAFLGAKYNLNEKMKAFAELGYGTAILNLGVNMSF